MINSFIIDNKLETFTAIVGKLLRMANVIGRPQKSRFWLEADRFSDNFHNFFGGLIYVFVYRLRPLFIFVHRESSLDFRMREGHARLDLLLRQVEKRTFP